MPAVWFALKRSLQCRSERGDVCETNGNGIENLSNISTKKASGSNSCGCSRSIANLKDVVIGSKRHTEKAPVCSPRSIGSSELLNPITHEVVLNNSTCELKISAGSGTSGDKGGDILNFVGMLKPGTPGPGRLHAGRRQKIGILGSPIRRSASNLSRRSSGFGTVASRPRSSFGSESCGALFCHKCGEQFVKFDAVEEHHLSKHAGMSFFSKFLGLLQV